MELKALEKSSRRVQRSLQGRDDIKREVAWTIASHPPLTHTPSCSGGSNSRTWWCTMVIRHYDTNRRKTSPTAMARWPPFFFLLARRVAPQRWGVMTDGARPEARRLTNLVRAAKTWLAWLGEGHLMASWRWLGRKPDGPGAELLGKDLTPL